MAKICPNPFTSANPVSSNLSLSKSRFTLTPKQSRSLPVKSRRLSPPVTASDGLLRRGAGLRSLPVILRVDRKPIAVNLIIVWELGFSASAPSASLAVLIFLGFVDFQRSLFRPLSQFFGKGIRMLRMNNEGSDNGSWEAGSYVHDDIDGNYDDEHYNGTDADNDEKMHLMCMLMKILEVDHNPIVVYDQLYFQVMKCMQEPCRMLKIEIWQLD